MTTKDLRPLYRPMLARPYQCPICGRMHTEESDGWDCIGQHSPAAVDVALAEIIGEETPAMILWLADRRRNRFASA